MQMCGSNGKPEKSICKPQSVKLLPFLCVYFGPNTTTTENGNTDKIHPFLLRLSTSVVTSIHYSCLYAKTGLN